MVIECDVILRYQVLQVGVSPCHMLTIHPNVH
jgi:hypothetical protein